MFRFKILVPFHAGRPCLELHGQLFHAEQVAIDLLTGLLNQKSIEYRIKRTSSGMVFFNTQQGELASVVSYPKIYDNI